VHKEVRTYKWIDLKKDRGDLVPLPYFYNPCNLVRTVDWSFERSDRIYNPVRIIHNTIIGNIMDKSNTKLCMGIDVSKSTLDIFWENKSYKISNDAQSIEKFIKDEIKSGQNLLCVLESTGGYEKLIAKKLDAANLKIHIAHPNRVHSFAKACNHFAKTDKLDAMLLHKYALFIFDETKGDILLEPRHQEISELRRLAKCYEDNLHADQCRLKQMSNVCTNHLNKSIKFYKENLEEIQKEIDDRINSIPDLKDKKKLMISLKGIGQKIASVLIAELPELGKLTRARIASLVGVAPKTNQSGTKEHKAHIFGGRFYVRKAIYMAALVAIRHDSEAKEIYEKMLQNQKPKKVAIVAIMRRIVIALNSMLRKGEKYEAKRA
jgi:transposase